MIVVFRKSLVIALAMLQLLAPLVHAHTGASNFNQGLHIPGLELFQTNQDTTAIRNVDPGLASEGLLVMVEAGIKNPLDFITEIEKGDYSPIFADPFEPRAITTSSKHSHLHQQSINHRRFFSLSRPRAPPTP